MEQCFFFGHWQWHETKTKRKRMKQNTNYIWTFCTYKFYRKYIGWFKTDESFDFECFRLISRIYFHKCCESLEITDRSFTVFERSSINYCIFQFYFCFFVHRSKFIQWQNQYLQRENLCRNILHKQWSKKKSNFKN